MKTTRNNKGAAMVSVLIAVSFIIILASSLMYMAYMNYITKAVRYQGTDNFYTDEYALDDLCMTMQQIAAECDTVENARDTLLSRVGMQPNTPHNGQQCYTNQAVADLIQVANKEATISVNTIYDTSVSGNLVYASNSIQLLGVEITSTTESGYQSTICADILLTFPNGGLGDLDVNDFSVIGDSPITVDEGDVFFSGCVYIDGGGRGHTALTVNSAGNVHILAPRGIINGDIYINGSGQLSITGIVTVNGDIYVNDKAVLLCSDQMEHVGDIHVDTVTGARVLGVSSSTFDGDDSIDTSSIPTNGMSELLLAPVYVYSNDWSEFRQVTLEDVEGPDRHLKYSISEQEGLPAVNVMIGMQNPENRNENSLVLSSRDVTIKGEFVNSTIVCGGTIIFQERSMPTYMQSMSDEAFAAAKIGVMGGALQLNPSGSGNGNCNFAGSRYSDIPDWDASGVQSKEYQAHGGEVRHFVYNSGTNYIPFGYFMADDTSRVITDVFSGVQGDANPVDTNIFVTNWIKE